MRPTEKPEEPKFQYVDKQGDSPFRDWLDSLDVAAKARIQARILTVESGNLGDHKSVGAGVMELRLDFGPGYRVYFGKDGDKGSQRRDIKKAQELWTEYLTGGKDVEKK